ncbi:coagulation factor 5/8 type domain protein, partial [bacterium]|nr:coagulation factor 5/8 type domain protein [bacterium]
MTSNGTYDQLYDWGLEVAVTDSYSIQNTSVRPYSITHGSCQPAVVENLVNMIPPSSSILSQNFP